MLRFTAVTEGDIPELRSLAHRIWHAHYPSIISTEQIDYMLERFFAAEVIRQELARGVQWELVWVDGRAAGFLCCVAEPDSGRLKLSKLYLLPELHGRGLGQEMLERVKASAGSQKAQEVYLTVNKRNSRAIRAYQKAGFEIADEIVADIGNGYVMDDFVMTWEVD